MARLPSERYLMQMIGTDVVLFEDGTEREIVRYDPSDNDDTMRANRYIAEETDLSTEDKAMASFWSGYFYAHAHL